jgi:hypothetical protein
MGLALLQRNSGLRILLQGAENSKVFAASLPCPANSSKFAK